MVKHEDKIESTHARLRHDQSDKPAQRESQDGRQDLVNMQKRREAFDKAGRAFGKTRDWDHPGLPSGRFPEQEKVLSLVAGKDFASAAEQIKEQLAKIETSSAAPVDKLEQQRTYLNDLAGELRKGWQYDDKTQTLTFDLRQTFGGNKDSGVISDCLSNNSLRHQFDQVKLNDSTELKEGDVVVVRAGANSTHIDGILHVAIVQKDENGNLYLVQKPDADHRVQKCSTDAFEKHFGMNIPNDNLVIYRKHQN
jgi:hypothetical protein